MNIKRSLIFFITLILCSLLFPALPALAYTDEAEADIIPWSGYWWPTTSGGLVTGLYYRGHPAPIEKYELIKIGRYPGDASFWELEYNFDPGALSWYGLCHAWASAAVTEHIDFKPSSYENIAFYVGDKKGLITACHGSDLREIGGASEPEVFHQWLLYYIKDNGLAFVAELDPTEEFWSYPVYKYSMVVTEAGGRMSVSCWIWYADDMVDPDIQGTNSLTALYTYDLYRNANEEITGGEWTGASASNHPGILWRPIAQAATNPYLDYELIRQIAGSQDDPFEGNGLVDLPPGKHNLVLMDEDRYRITCNEGDLIFFAFEKDKFSEEIALEIKDTEGVPVFTSLVEEGEEVSWVAENPPYSVTVSRDEYGGGEMYTIAFDLKTEHEYLIPRIQQGGAWFGLALTNAGDQRCENINIVAFGDGGELLTTVMGPFSLSAGEKRAFLLSDFPIRKHEQGDLRSLKVLAGSSLSIVSFNGRQDRTMSGFNRPSTGSRLVIPEITSWLNSSGTGVSWGIYNQQAVQEEEVSLRLFSREGRFLKEKSLTIAGNSSLSYSPSQSPFGDSGDGGWVLIEGLEGSRLEGYFVWSTFSETKSESLFALGQIGSQFFVPHIAYDRAWKTKLTLINVSGRENVISFTLTSVDQTPIVSLTLNPFEKTVIDIADLFPLLSPEILNQSSLIIESGEESTGFYIYETSESIAYYPFMSEQDVSPDLVVTHVASDAYWWTGVAIFNPGNEPAFVSLLPFTQQGTVMTDQIKDIALGGQEKKAFCVGAFFNASRVRDIASIKVTVENGTGVAGIFLYGDRGVKAISGSNMHPIE